MKQIFSKNRIRFEQLFDDARDFLTQQYNQAGQVFSIASAWGQLLYVFQQISNLIFFYVEDSVTELNLNTATRTDSIRGLARLTGHNVSRGISATGSLTARYNGSELDFTGNSIIIHNWTKIINNQNGIPYLIRLDQEALYLQVSDGYETDLNIVQGEIEIQNFTGDGTALQSFAVNMRGGRNIENNFVFVYVNGTLWDKYESIYDIPYQTNGYIVKTGINGGLDIYFGNSFFGSIPPEGANITVEYIVTAGIQGNLRETNNPTFTFEDSGFDITGQEINLNDYFNLKQNTIIDFGANAEPIALTRLLAPKISKSLILINPENFVYFLGKFRYFSIIDVFNNFESQDINDENVMYLFLVPDINNRILDTENYFTTDINNFTLSDEENTRVIDLIENSGQKALNIDIDIVKPILRYFIININIVAFKGYSRELIRTDIIDALSQYFSFFTRRDRLPKSDIIRIIENVDGVDSVNVSFISRQYEELLLDNQNSDLVGLDKYGDIIIQQNELPIIRGGWSDRNSVFYEDSVIINKPSSVNIEFDNFITENNRLI